MNQINGSNLEKKLWKNARPDYPARGPDNPPPAKISQKLAANTNVIDWGRIHIQQDS
jgi:hypothetical protein